MRTISNSGPGFGVLVGAAETAMVARLRDAPLISEFTALAAPSEAVDSNNAHEWITFKRKLLGCVQKGSQRFNKTFRQKIDHHTLSVDKASKMAFKVWMARVRTVFDDFGKDMLPLMLGS